MPSTSTSRGRSGLGRIRPHERDTDNTTEVIGNNLAIDGYENEIHGTMCHDMSDNTRKNWRQRIKKIIAYWKSNHPQYYQMGVREVT